MAETNNIENVAVGKPKAGGAVFAVRRKDLGTGKIPTDATTALDAAFKCLGYISEDGVTDTPSSDSESIKAWGGDTVANPRTSYDEEYVMTFIEQRQSVFEIVFGKDNVTVNENGGIAVKHTGDDHDEYIYVVETVLNAKMIMRTVIPRGKVTEIGDIVRKDDEPMGYESTIGALPDSTGGTAYDYFAAVA